MTNPNYAAVIQDDLRSEFEGHAIARHGTLEQKLANHFGGQADNYTHMVAGMRLWAPRNFMTKDTLAFARAVVDLQNRGGSAAEWEAICKLEPGRRVASTSPSSKSVYNEKAPRRRIADLEQFVRDLELEDIAKRRKKIAELQYFVDNLEVETPWEVEARRRANEEQFLETCRHESLHAAVVMDRGGRVTELVVNRSNNSGQCVYADLPPKWQPVVDIAGSLAHPRGRGLYEAGCESDREMFVAGVDAILPSDITAYERDCALGARMIDAEKHAELIWSERGLFVHHLTDWLSRKNRLSEQDVRELWEDCYPPDEAR